jgi:hypothetical protein
VVDSLQFPPSEDYNFLVNSDDPDYEWVVPDLVEAGDRVIFTGGEGKGKSTLLRQMALQVALGIHPFTLEAIEPQRVLYIDLENPKRYIRREFKKLGQHEPAYGMLSIVGIPGGVDLLAHDGQMAMVAKLEEHKPQLLLIGPMYKMTQQPLEQEQFSKLLSSQLDQWRKVYGFALFLESHQPHGSMIADNSGKGGARMYRPERPVGSSLWLRWPEFGYCLEDGGLLRPWRGGRDADRAWPDKLVRGDDWLWRVADGGCLKCGAALNPRQEKYCSDKCSNAARQAKWRVTRQAQVAIPLDEMTG